MSPLQKEIASAEVLEQAREAAYERLCLGISEDIRQIMKEQGVTIKELAVRLCWPESRLRQWVKSGDMRILTLSRILFALGLELHPLFKPRKEL